MEQFIKVGHSSEGKSFVGKILVSTPYLNDSIFEKVLIYICSHDELGAVGVVFNTHLDAKAFLEIDTNNDFELMYGGPVEESKVFILSASSEGGNDESQNKELYLYSNANRYLIDHINGKIKGQFKILQGYCGWDAGQLDEEVQENSWIVIDVDYDLIFSENRRDEKWAIAVKKAGIRDIKHFKDLVSYSGNA